MITEAINVEDAVDAALPVVRHRVDDIHADRRLPDVVVSSLRATGVNRMVLPTLLGGLEIPTSDALEGGRGISAVDGAPGGARLSGPAATSSPAICRDTAHGTCSPTRPGQGHDVRSARHARAGTAGRCR